MGYRYFYLFASFGLLAACSKSPQLVSPPPQAVNASAVKTVIVSENASDQAVCSTEVKASGGQVLYQNDLGVVMTDQARSDLHLSRCQAAVNENVKLDLNVPRPARGKAPKAPEDLAALLKLIPAEDMGARTFVKNNPTYDGRGVLVAILDTGIEMDHPMLTTTSTGEPKIADFQDFSGEGNLTVKAVTLDAGTFKDGDTTYSAKQLAGTDYRFGIFPGKSLEVSSAGEVDTFSDVAVVVYKNSRGEWRGRIDTNDDKSFDDEKELFNYQASRAFTKLGEDKKLTTALNIKDDGSGVSLIFDDGGHGTHVAGISTGYSAEGLQGVAPGARVILGKIGDNRLSGGSTTTASMMLAIDFAARSKADIVNMSYGIRPGANLGKSAIDQYVDKVAAKTGMLFSISAGNEGPGMLTVGMPAAANLAITNAAYLSKETAANNYGWTGMTEGSTWFFSSVGPRLDGGWKPTLLAPGTALASVPNWESNYSNKSGTSMASPETTGALALILSAARQARLLTDRATITRAVYDGATKLPSLALIEQGHGLLNVPATFERLKTRTTPANEYRLSVTSPANPEGKGQGIFVHSRVIPSNLYNVTVAATGEASSLGVLKLVPSANWIKTPEEFWMVQGAPRTFQVRLDAPALSVPGLYSEKIDAVNAATGAIEFEIPVTVVVPTALDFTNGHSLTASELVAVGRTKRYFIDVPVGATSVEVKLASNGPQVWARLLDPEGQTVSELRDSEATEPMAKLRTLSEITKPGVYEIAIVNPAGSTRAATVTLSAKAYSLTTTVLSGEANKPVLVVQNNYEAIKVTAAVELRGFTAKRSVVVNANGTRFDLGLTDADKKRFASVELTFDTPKAYYDLMTDYPYRIFAADGSQVDSGGLEVHSKVTIGKLDETPSGDLTVDVAGAFTEKAPESWGFVMTRTLRLPAPQVLLPADKRRLIENGQTLEVAVDLAAVKGTPKDYDGCPTLVLKNTEGEAVQETLFCGN
jgi:tripeptidyl-peptidase-2